MHHPAAGGVPPPTPQNTGTSAASIRACVMMGCGVKGYTAITASALQLRMTATSVEKTMLFILLPKMTMPLHW